MHKDLALQGVKAWADAQRRGAEARAALSRYVASTRMTGSFLRRFVEIRQARHSRAGNGKACGKPCGKLGRSTGNAGAKKPALGGLVVYGVLLYVLRFVFRSASAMRLSALAITALIPDAVMLYFAPIALMLSPAAWD